MIAFNINNEFILKNVYQLVSIKHISSLRKFLLTNLLIVFFVIVTKETTCTVQIIIIKSVEKMTLFYICKQTNKPGLSGLLK
jgi:hypothetical protein